MKTLIRILFSSFLFCFFNSAFSFGQEIEWQNTIGGNAEDQLYALAQTTDGGYILGGNSLSGIVGDKTENSNGSWDYWILKIDATGNIQWQNTIGGSGSDYLRSIKQTSDGGYIIGGYSDSNISGDKTDSAIGMTDYWIVKTDSLGNIQWQNTIGGSSQDELFSLEQTSDNGYILGGRSISDSSGDKTENCKGLWDYWIVKIDIAGNVTWENTIGGNNWDVLNSVMQTTDNGYILGGYSMSPASGDKTENSWNTDYWIVKVDSTGNIQWQNTISANHNDYLTSVKQTNDGGYILGGYSESDISGDKTENSQGQGDYWVIKTDSLGFIQWQNTIGGSLYETLFSLQQTNDGGYILGGSSGSSISGDKAENQIGNNDFWVLKLDSLGSIAWQNTIGGNWVDEIRSIAQTNDNGYIIGGYSKSTLSGDKTENGWGNGDYWIVKLTVNYNLITGSSFADLNSNSIKNVSESAFTQQKIIEQNTGRFAFTQPNGYYSLVVLDSGNFNVATTSAINYYNSVPTNHIANFPGINQIDSLNDFAFQPTGVFNDLCVTISPTGPFRSGFNASYIINYENVGTTTLSGDVIFFPYNNVTYVSSNITPTSIALDSIVWNTGLLTPFQSGSITVTVNVNAGLPIGTLVNSSVRIEPVAGDANPGCNYHSWEVYTIGSYDPNDILVNEDTLFTTQLPSQPWLDYTIRFQNTGNDTAFTVNVLNPIDTTKLELSSIEFVNSSHPVNLNWIPWERNMEFKFNNILLPDSNINEPLSHGFVHYRIKPKTTLLAGDSITNNAYIYFDFNAPVATNTAVTKIVLPTGIAPLSWGEGPGVRCFPNPAKDEITLAGYALQNNQPAVLKIYDVMSKEIISQSIVNHTSQIVDLKSFSSGVYFLQLQTGAKVSRVKFIKQ